MTIKVPVYSEEGGIPKITVFQGMDDGTFRRTSTQLLREFNNSFADLGVSEGELISNRYDVTDREWQTPTALHNYGRAKSFYAFTREKIKDNKLYVATTSSMRGRIVKFSLHELKFKSSASRGLKMLAAKRYQEAIDLRAA